MTDDLDTRLASLEERISGMPDSIGAALDRALGVSAPAAPAAPARPAASTAPSPASAAELRAAKLNSFDPWQSDPDQITAALLTIEEFDTVERIRNAATNGSTLDERMELNQRWNHLWQANRANREARLEELAANHAAKVEAQRQAAIEVRESERAMQDSAISDLAGQATRVRGSELFAGAVETGAFDLSSDQLQKLGWGPQERAALDRVKQERVIQVSGAGAERADRDGFLVADREDGTALIYVPDHEDAAAMKVRYV